MRCPTCGTENNKKALVCKKCGTRLINPKDDAFSWADNLDFTRGIEWEEENPVDSEPEEHQNLEPESPQEQADPRLEDYLEEPEENVQENGEPDQPEEEEDDDDAGVSRSSIQKAVLIVLIGCLVLVLIAMAVVAMNLLGQEKDENASVAATVEETRRESTEIITNLFPVSEEETTTESIEATETAQEPTMATETSTVTTEAPATTTEVPTTLTEVPATTTEAPATTTEVPATLTEAPTTTTEAPTTAIAAAEGNVTIEGVSYTIKDNRATLTRYDGNAARIELPAEVNGAPLMFIANDAFKGNTSLQMLDIPEGVLTVGTDTFYGCTGLTAIVIPDSMVLIGEGAFDYCSVFKIYCHPGTYAETFCNQWNVAWVNGDQLP